MKLMNCGGEDGNEKLEYADDMKKLMFVHNFYIEVLTFKYSLSYFLVCIYIYIYVCVYIFFVLGGERYKKRAILHAFIFNKGG